LNRKSVKVHPIFGAIGGASVRRAFTRGARMRCPVATEKRNNKGVLMKKLMMFAAAMTIVGGAYAQCEDPDPTPGNCALAYDVKISVKSTIPESTKGYTISSPCEDDVDLDGGCFRKIGKYSYQGLLYTCDCECNAIADATFYLWNKKAKEYVVYGDTITWSFLNIIGKKQKDAEGYFTFDTATASFVAAGFGTWDTKNNWLKSLSGSIVGAGAPPECDDANYCGAAAAFICTDLSFPDDTLPTAYAGTFSLKYSSGKAKALAVNESAALSKYLPKGFSFVSEPLE
jgi:hypothetical protein